LGIPRTGVALYRQTSKIYGRWNKFLKINGVNLLSIQNAKRYFRGVYFRSSLEAATAIALIHLNLLAGATDNPQILKN